VSELGRMAIAYARRGWYVFPVAPRGKTPITKRGMLDASTDEGLVAAWWELARYRSKLGRRAEQRARPNIGVACAPPLC
jgi:hypothetical protein